MFCMNKTFLQTYANLASHDSNLASHDSRTTAKSITVQQLLFYFALGFLVVLFQLFPYFFAAFSQVL